MKKLEEAAVDPRAQELGKRIIPDGKSKGVAVISYQFDGEPPQIIVQSYKKQPGGWRPDGSSTHSAATWKALAEAITDLVK